MEPHAFAKLKEALRMLSFRRHGMAAEALEELVTETNHPEPFFWLAYVYRRMRRYDRAIETLERLEGFGQTLEQLKAEQRSYALFRQAMELQGRGEYRQIRKLLQEARSNASEDPDLTEWIEEELGFYGSSFFD